MKCWELRGCDEEMQSRCPHNTPGEPCPAECNYSACNRPTYEPATDILDLLIPELDYDAANKEVCRTCKFFLGHGPQVVAGEPRQRKGNPNRFLF